MVSLSDPPDMTVAVYRGCKTTRTHTLLKMVVDHKPCLVFIGHFPVNQRRTTTTQRVPNVHGVWNTLDSLCTNVAGSLGSYRGRKLILTF